MIPLALLFASAGWGQTPEKAAAPAVAASTQFKHHTIFELSEAQGPTWDAVIRHATNLRKALEKDGGVQMEIVFFGQGLKMLLKSNKEFEEKLKKLADDGVILAACQNAMKAMKVKSEDLFPFAVEVDSGVAEITRRQEAGWAYIH
jgi:intracellular sulfur oxidation DsrE/DsrF family protein